MFAAVAMASAAAPAAAQDPSVEVTGRSKVVTVSERVSYAGLDLATDRGQERLRARILAAADRVCTDREELWTAFSDRKYRKCFAQAKAGAVRQAGRVMYASAN
jgi:UrcA family protein